MKGAAVILACFIAMASGYGWALGLMAFFSCLYLLLIHDY